MKPLTILPLDQGLSQALQHKIDHKTKPLGALGQLEALALQIGLVQQTLSPVLESPTVFVFAADHGIVAEGVSPYPQAVTAQMVLNFVQGGAAINQFAQQTGMRLQVVDAGVNADFAPDLPLVHAKVAKGTQSFMQGPAMSPQACEQAMQTGARLVQEAVNTGCNVLALGEMGIGNTSSAAALMSVLCHLPPEQCVGRGTGLDDAGVQHKAAVLRTAKANFSGDPADALAVLAHFGGFEIAMMVGALLQAAQSKVLILVDGFIATSAVLVARQLAPAMLAYCVFCHCSNEQAHRRLLAYLGGQPLLDLGLRLGEGTGAVLAYPLVQAAVGFLNGMASFDSAGVSARGDGVTL